MMIGLDTIVIIAKSYQAATISVLVLTIIWLINMVQVMTTIVKRKPDLKDKTTQTYDLNRITKK